MRINKRIGKQWRGNPLPPPGCMVPFSLLLIITSVFLLGVAANPSLFGVNLLAPRWVAAVEGMIFLGGGITLGILSVHVWRRNRQSKALSNTPEFPCQTDYAWSPIGIGDDNTNIPLRSLWQAIPLGFFLVLFHVMLLAFLREVRLAGKVLTFAVLGLFDLIFLGLVSQVVYWGWQRLRFGSTRARFGRFPFYPGTELIVTFEGGPKLSNTPLAVSLRCVEERALGFDDSPGLECYAIYHDQQQYATDSKGQAAISFSLPADVPGTCLSRKMPTYWELIVKAQITNGRYEGLFLMPVYSKGI